METDITMTQARNMVADPTWDAYGTARIYGVYGPDSVYRGQIAGVKSGYQLDELEREGYERIYVATNDGTGMPPIRRAKG